jgi:hypothetical protein
MRARLGRMIMCPHDRRQQAELHSMADRIGIPSPRIKATTTTLVALSGDGRASGSARGDAAPAAAMLWLMRNGQAGRARQPSNE